MAWYEEFFEGDWLDLQRACSTRETGDAVAAALCARLALPAGAQVLDVPCGHGPVALGFARRGYVVTGVDRTRALLEDARRTAAAEGLAVGFEERDMRDLPWTAHFDLVVNWWTSVGFFDAAGEREFAAALARVLKPGGTLALEATVLETLLPQFQERRWSDVGPLRVLERTQVDWIQGRARTEWTFEREGRVTSRRTSDLRLYSVAELRALLEQAGFERFEAAANLAGAAFGPGRRLVMLARRGG